MTIYFTIAITCLITVLSRPNRVIIRSFRWYRGIRLIVPNWFKYSRCLSMGVILILCCSRLLLCRTIWSHLLSWVISIFRWSRTISSLGCKSARLGGELASFTSTWLIPLIKCQIIRSRYTICRNSFCRCLSTLSRLVTSRASWVVLLRWAMSWRCCRLGRTYCRRRSNLRTGFPFRVGGPSPTTNSSGQGWNWVWVGVGSNSWTSDINNNCSVRSHLSSY